MEKQTYYDLLLIVAMQVLYILFLANVMLNNQLTNISVQRCILKRDWVELIHHLQLSCFLWTWNQWLGTWFAYIYLFIIFYANSNNFNFGRKGVQNDMITTLLCCQHICWLNIFHFGAKLCVHKNNYSIKLDRCGQLQGCVTECLQRLGQNVPAACFHPLTLLFKGYMFIQRCYLSFILLINFCFIKVDITCS